MKHWKLAVAIWCIAGSAAAADQGWYLGGALGLATSHYGAGDATRLGYNPGATIDNDDLGAEVYGGYRLNANWAVEAAYVNLGRAKFSGLAGSTGAKDKISAEGLSLSLLGKVPLTQDFSLFGKLGAFAANAKYECVQNCGGIQNNDKDGVYATFGVGAQYDVSPHLALRAEYERFNGLKSAAIFNGSTTEFKSDYDLFTLGVHYQF